MKKSNNKVLTIILIILLIALIGLIMWVIQKNEQGNGTITTANRIYNETKNELNEQEINTNIQTNAEQNNNVVNNEISKENEVQGNSSSETFEEDPKTEEEKAIEIAKKDWGNTTGVYFDVDGIEPSGEYRVLVTKDTKLIAYYMVNVSNETFTKKVLNN